MVQKVIKIGSSAGVTIPAKQLKELGIGVGDDVEISVSAVRNQTQDVQILQAARAVLAKHKRDFDNLAKR